MESMTGFGRGDSVGDFGTIVVELKGVNGKTVEVKTRAPRELAFLEAEVTETLRRAISRGRVDCFLSLTSTTLMSRAPRVDAAALAALLESLRAALAAVPGVDPHVRAGDLLRVPAIVRVDDAALDEEAIRASVKSALDAALESFVASRRAEGALLHALLSTHLDRLSAITSALGLRAAGMAARAKTRLTERIQELLGEVPLDAERVAQEVAILADRADIAEELDRLGAHVVHFRSLIDAEGQVGRKLDFLCQELHREANTAGSKSTDVEAAHLVVELKTEIERLREQVQNVV
jgi:uncharacterized protein (TIGR00255 family)